MIKTLDWLEPLINWFWNNRQRILDDVNLNVPLVGGYYGFQVYYPEYGGMPSEISEHLEECHLDILNSKVVFLLQDYDIEDVFKNKLLKALTNSTVVLS